MAVLDITPDAAGQNPKAPGVLTFNREGGPAGFQASTEGDVTAGGTTTLNNLVVTGTATGPFGGGSTVVMTRGAITTGSITTGADAAWTALGATSVLIPAVAGDSLLFIPTLMTQPVGGSYYDFAVRAGGSLVRYASSGGAAPCIEGDPGLYPGLTTYRTTGGGVFEFVVDPADLTGGNVEIVMVHKGSSGDVVYASTDYPFRWRCLNLGQ